MHGEGGEGAYMVRGERGEGGKGADMVRGGRRQTW